MGALVKIVDRKVSKETVDAIASLLPDAQQGRVRGMAYVVLMDDGKFEADVVGAAKTSPLLTLGMMRILEIRIAKLTQK